MKKVFRSFFRYRNLPYVTVNGILCLLMSGILVYSLVFSPGKNNYPIPGSHELFGIENDISNGLSRSFSEMIRGHIDAARKYNEHGPGLFLFFLVQVVLRPVFSLSYSKSGRQAWVIWMDASLSAILFMAAFGPFFIRLAERLGIIS